jgi:homoserine dehydrogenase
LKLFRVGLLGFGNVNRAFVEHYLKIAHKISTNYGFKLKFVAACDTQSFIYKKNLNMQELIDIKKKELLLGKHNTNPLNKFISVIKDKKIDIIIDGLPSSRTEEGPSYPVLVKALKKKIIVICVNKAPLVFKGNNLLQIAKRYKTHLGISGTAAGSLPASGIIINELAGSEVVNIRGIVNGTSNYVLDCMMFEGLSSYEAIKRAINLGIAEPDYRFDLEGIDTCFKMIIFGLIITGKSVPFRNIPCTGITQLTQEYISSIVQQGKVIRLVGNLSADNNNPVISVRPEVLDDKDSLYAVRGTGKGITVKTRHMGELTIIGGSSGRTNIAAAILKDIINECKA